MTDEEAIRALVQDWIASTKRGDHAHVLTLMADDVLFHVPGMPEPFGKEAFRNFPAPGSMEVRGEAETLEVIVSGDIAYARNFLDLTVLQSGITTQQRGYTLGFYKRSEEGQWQLWRDANFVSPAK